MNRIGLIGLCLLCALWQVILADVTKINDEFDDTDVRANTKGIGNGFTFNYNSGAPSCSQKEQNGALEIGVSQDQASVWIMSRPKDDFPFWNSNGATVTWVLKEMNVQTPHCCGGYLAFTWQLGVVSARANRMGWVNAGNNQSGGFYVFLGKRDGNDNSVEFGVEVVNKTNPAVHGDPTGKIWFSKAVFNAVYPIVITAKLTSSGWAVTTNQNMSGAKLSGNWTTDCRNGTVDASITDEFDTTAFIMAQAYELDDTHAGNSFPANTGKIDRVTVVLHGVIAPSIERGVAPLNIRQRAGAVRFFDVTGARRSPALPVHSILLSASADGKLEKRVNLKQK